MAHAFSTKQAGPKHLQVREVAKLKLFESLLRHQTSKLSYLKGTVDIYTVWLIDPVYLCNIEHML